MYAAKNPSPVVTTVPLSFLDPVTTTADKKAKPKPLQRRKSLNPRLMAPPGLESLENREMVAVRQQMQADITGKSAETYFLRAALTASTEQTARVNICFGVEIVRLQKI